MKRFVPSLGMWLVFESIALILWQVSGSIFYLFNFSYIGTCIAVGLALYACKWRHARRFVQFAVGLYMFGFLGLIEHENMQIEGFWYYLFLGVFQGATIHYLIAKIAGPALFGRGWCGYACWTAMILDLLPWKRSSGRRRGLGWIRYGVLIASLAFVAATLLLDVANESLYFTAFLVGNLVYYLVGIGLAATLKDNRAFCKYICPVGVLMKPASFISLSRVKCDTGKCVSCGACKQVCPMDVDMTDNSRKRLNGTECILCGECIDACPKGALRF